MYNSIVNRVGELKNLNKLTLPPLQVYDHKFNPAVPIKDIMCLDKLQRLLVSGEVRSIAKKFDWKYFGTVTLIRLPDGTLNCCDGQQRTAAACIVGHTTVPATIISGTETDAGQTFIEMNNASQRVSATATFLAQLKLGDVEANTLDSLAQKYGYFIDEKPVPGFPTITTMTGYKQLVKFDTGNNTDHFFTKHVLKIMSKAWPGEDPIAAVMRAIGMFLYYWEQHLFNNKTPRTLSRGVIDFVDFFKHVSTDSAHNCSQKNILKKVKEGSSGENGPFRQFMLFSHEYNKLKRVTKKKGLLDEEHIKDMERLNKPKKYAKG